MRCEYKEKHFPSPKPSLVLTGLRLTHEDAVREKVKTDVDWGGLFLQLLLELYVSHACRSGLLFSH